MGVVREYIIRVTALVWRDDVTRSYVNRERWNSGWVEFYKARVRLGCQLLVGFRLRGPSIAVHSPTLLVDNPIASPLSWACLGGTRRRPKVDEGNKTGGVAQVPSTHRRAGETLATIGTADGTDDAAPRHEVPGPSAPVTPGAHAYRRHRNTPMATS